MLFLLRSFFAKKTVRFINEIFVKNRKKILNINKNIDFYGIFY